MNETNKDNNPNKINLSENKTKIQILIIIPKMIEK